MSSARRRAVAWLAALTGTGGAAIALLGLLVLAAVFTAMAIPRASLGNRTIALQRVLQSVPVAGRSAVAVADYFSVATALALPGTPASQVTTGQLRSIRALIGRRLARDGVPLEPARTRWSGLTSGTLKLSSYPLSVRGTAPPRLQIVYRDALGRSSRLAAGTWPAGSSVVRNLRSRTVTAARFDVAVTAATATRFSLRPGSVIHLGPDLSLTVTGILRPARPASSFWVQDPAAAAAFFDSDGRGGGYWVGSVFIPASELVNLERAIDTSTMTLTWDFPLRLDAVTADQAGPLVAALQGASATAGLIGGGPSGRPVSNAPVLAGIIGPLTQFVQAQGQVDSLVSMLEVSLAIVGAVVVLLGAALLAERRAAELAVMRARGAAPRQLAAIGFLAGLTAVIPAAACGLAAAMALTPGGDGLLAWWLAGGTMIVALAAVPWLAVGRASRGQAQDERADRPPTRAERLRRTVADVALAVAAIGGLAVLRHQGLSQSGADLYTSAAPALVALPVAILTVRGYPHVVRLLARLAGRGRGVTMFVGLARAARVSVTAVLPAFALVLVLAVVGFGALLRASIVRADSDASWQAVGADVVVAAARGGALDAGAVRAISAVPGVRRTCAVSALPAVAGSGAQVVILAMDSARYRALVAGTPQAGFPAGNLTTAGAGRAVPVLASPAAAADLRGASWVLFGSRPLRVRVTAVVPSPVGQAASGEFIVIANQAVRASSPNLLLIVGSGISAGRLRAVVAAVQPKATLTFRSQVQGTLARAPLPHSAYVTFTQGAAAAATFGALILALMLALGARSRRLTLARLVTLGLSQRQASALVAAEALPPVAAAAAGGVVAIVALVPLLAPAINLSLFTGSPAPVGAIRADLSVLWLMAGGLLALSLLTLWAQAAVTRRRGVARALRVGE